MNRTLVPIALAIALGACNRAEWQAEVYEHLTPDDVFTIAQYRIGSDYAIDSIDPQAREIVTRWNYDTFAPGSRLPARERVVARVTPVDEGVELRLRVQRQARDERIGYRMYDEDGEDWEDIADDVDRAEVIFQKIRISLVELGPREGYTTEPLLPADIDR